MDGVLDFIVGQIIWIIAAIIVITLFFLSCVKVGPDKAIIISGAKKSPRILVGRTGFKIPFIERIDQLPLQQLDIEISSGKYVPTVDFISTLVDVVGTVRISQKEEMLAEAIKNFLNKIPEEIALDLQRTLQANIREVIGMMHFKEIVTNPEKFAENLAKKITVHLNQLGIELLSLHVQTIDDENRLTKALGAEQVIEIQKTASIQKAEMERDIEIAQMALEQEKSEAKKATSIQKAEMERDIEIAQVALEQEASEAKKAAEIIRMENDHELHMRAAALKKIADAEQAEAEAVYAEMEMTYKQKLEQLEANAKLTAKEREIELNRQAADSDLYVRTKEAEALKIEAETETYRAEQGTELMKAQHLTIQEEAEAMLYMRTKEAEAEKKKVEVAHYIDEQEVQIVKLRGLAEVDILKAKKLAEAEGIAAKGNAMSTYGQAAMLEMMVGVLPEVAKSMARSVGTNDAEGMKKVMEFIQEATGLNIKEALLTSDQAETGTTLESEQAEVKTA